MKCKKMELAAEERLLGIKQKMQEDELASKEQILCMELELAQLRGDKHLLLQVPILLASHRRVTQ